MIKRAAELIRAGRLVAFPTETVYGLGANALDETAIRRVFAAKRRPFDDPLIVHVSSIEMARSLVRIWPREAQLLAERHWPGPLTLVLLKQPVIPDAATAGLGTVGIRMPAHPITLALIEMSGVPIVGPSANRFTELSPTTAQHVRDSLGDAVDMILDGGSTPVGIESTVLSLATPRPVLFRPGMITREEIEELIGPIDVAGTPQAGPQASPGMHKRHYSPHTRLLLLKSKTPTPAGNGVRLAAGNGMPADACHFAAALYAKLHELDQRGLDWIAIDEPPDLPAWAGIRDRLRRAAAPPA